MVIPVQIAVIGLLGAAYYGYHAVKGPEPESTGGPSRTATATPTPSPTPEVATKRLVSKQGGFAVGVPEDVKAKKVGPAVTMATADKVLSAVVSPVESGPISVSTKAFMRGMKEVYTKVEVTRTETLKIDGHKATATYGQARNAKKVQIRFVNFVIKSTPRNFAINAFTARDSDPLFVLPRVNAIANTFEVIK
ncbi:MAG: hypothetical protein ACRDOT_07210 [Aeromicrobium sp.]